MQSNFGQTYLRRRRVIATVDSCPADRKKWSMFCPASKPDGADPGSICVIRPITPSPTRAVTVDPLTQNAIDLAISIGVEQPKVGVLSATETVNPDIPSSIDAALLSKMADRGQITGGLVDGPLAMDNAVDIAAARTKGITSAVAGQAE